MSPGSGAVPSSWLDFGILEMTGVGTDSHASGRRVSLLLIEDDDALRQMLVWELSELGYRVYPVASCAEARAAIAARSFELALMDVGLPDGNGGDLAAELVESDPDLRIVLCSGRPGAIAPERVPFGVLACLTKPVSVCRLDRLFRCKS